MRARFVLTLMLLTCLVPGPVMAQCEGWIRGPIDDGMAPNGTDGSILATVAWDPDGAGPLQERLVIAGNFSEVAGVPAEHVAQYDPATAQWSAFGDGLSAIVNALVVFNGQVVAGTSGDNDVGSFDQTVRVWDGSAWQALSATNTGSVYALVVHDGSLYIGGSFLTHFTPGTLGPAHGVARWSEANHLWIPLPESGFPSETSSVVRALTSFNGALYVGGSENHPTNPGALPVLTRFDGANWTRISNMTDGGVIYALGNFAGELIVGGGFHELLGTTGLNGIAGWNGSTMHAFHTGVSSAPPASQTVRAIWYHGGIVIGGDFESASGLSVNNVALWPAGGSSWVPLSSGTDGPVYAFCTYQSQLIAGGTFANATVPANNLARWNSLQWSTFGGGTSNWILSYIPYNGRLVAGGYFTQPTASLNAAFNIAGWNGGTFTNFGTGMNGQVVALEAFKYAGVNGDFELLAGGTFTVAGGVGAQRIARWREDPVSAFPPPAWSAMGSGFNNTVQAIERANNVTYAGGGFTASGGTVLNRIAQWNETTDVWVALGTGMNGTVNALKYYNGYLYAGGAFTTAGGLASGGLARWNGSAWSVVGGNFLGTVYALEVHDGMLYIGGVFPGLANGSNIARYDGASYSNVGSGGANGAVTELLSSGTRLYVGGSFTAIGGVSANHVGYWDGANWVDMDGGTDGGVSALGRWGNEINVGGSFTGVYGGPPVTPHWARWSETGLPFFTLHPSPFSQVGTLGGTVTFSTALGGGFTNLEFQWYHDDMPVADGSQPSSSTVVYGAHSQVLTIESLVPSWEGNYRVEVSNTCGSLSSGNGTVYFDPTAAPAASETVFYGVGPNPSGGSTQLAFSLAQPARVSFAIYDLRGRRVRAVDLGVLPSGRHEAGWDARDGGGSRVAAGVYFVALELDGDRLDTRRVTILR